MKRIAFWIVFQMLLFVLASYLFLVTMPIVEKMSVLAATDNIRLSVVGVSINHRVVLHFLLCWTIVFIIVRIARIDPNER